MTCEEAPFIGRETELRAIQQAIDAAMAGSTQLVTVSGEAGVGKSRLVSHALTGALGVSGLLLRVTCVDTREAPLPFGPISSALRQLDRLLDDESRKELVEPVRADLAGLLPVLESTDQTMASTTSRSQLFERVASLLEGLSGKGAVALVLEDFHWADRSTQDLVSFLQANLADVRLLLVLTCRDDSRAWREGMSTHIAQLSRHRNATRISLQPLVRDQLAQHVYDLAGNNATTEVVDAICERSQGNPFYAEELLVAVRDNGAGSLPRTLHDMLLARVRDAPEDTQDLLRVLAVGDDTVSVDLLTIVMEADGRTNVERKLRTAIECGLVRYDPVTETVRFRHALLREVTYADLLPGERRRLHARWADVVESSSMPPAEMAFELARHCVRAAMPVAGFSASLTAAELAELSGGYAESVTHLENALAMLDRLPVDVRNTAPRREELLARCAAMSHLAGDNDAAVARAREALSMEGAALSRSQVLVDLGCYLHAAGHSREALDVHSSALREMSAGDPHRGDVLCAHAQSLSAAAFHREAVAAATDALDEARTIGDRDLEARALTVLGHDLVAIGQEDDGSDALNRALDLSEQIGEAPRIAEAYRTAAATLAGPLNRLEDALQIAVRGMDRVEMLGLDRHWGVALRSVAIDTLFRLGRWPEAENLLTHALRRAPKGTAAIDLYLARAKLAVGSGDFALAQEDLDTVATLAARAIDLRYRVPLATLRAGLALWQRRVDDAVSAVEEGITEVVDTDDVWFVAPLLWHGMRAYAEQSMMNPARASTAIASASALLVELRQRSDRAEAVGSLRMLLDAYDCLCRGELSRMQTPADVDVWQEVVTSWESLGHPYPTAYARFRMAEALSYGRKRRSNAAELLRTALDAVDRMEALPLRLEIEALAQRSGIDLQVPELVIDVRTSSVLNLPPGVPALTKREQQVLDLVASGHGNRAIADMLFISEKTASVHVSNIMSKLGARSRGEVAAIVHNSRI